MEDAIIGVLGAGLLGLLGFMLQGIRSDIRALSTRLDRVEARLTGVEARLTGVEARLTGVEARLTGAEAALARVEVTLAEHGRCLVQMEDHGERIAALEGRTGAG